MVISAFGKPKSGKSIYVENLVALLPGSSAYIGTLPNDALYADVIVEHQARRPKRWSLIEFTHDPLRDMDLLQDAISTHNHVILDGPSVYFCRQLFLSETLIDVVIGRFLSLIAVASELSHTLYFIDPPLQGLRRDELRIMSVVHRDVFRCSSTIYWVDNETVTSITNEEALVRDNLEPV